MLFDILKATVISSKKLTEGRLDFYVVVRHL